MESTEVGDYDPSKALAEKMAATDGVSQEEILGLIKTQKTLRHQLEIHGKGKEDTLELSSSNWLSNKSGGMTKG